MADQQQQTNIATSSTECRPRGDPRRRGDGGGDDGRIIGDGRTSSSSSSQAPAMFKYVRGFALTACAIAAYLGQQQEEQQQLLHEEQEGHPHLIDIDVDAGLLSHRSVSVLNGTWVVIYVLLVRFLLSSHHQLGIAIEWARLLLARRWMMVAAAKEGVGSASTQHHHHGSTTELVASVSMNRSSTVSLAYSSSARILSVATSTAEQLQYGGGCGSRIGSTSRQRQQEEEQPPLLLSSPDPFLPIEEISKLSLTDVRDIFRYAEEVCQPSFDRQAFLESCGPGLRLRRRDEPPTENNALDAIDRVVEAFLGLVEEQGDRGSSSSSSLPLVPASSNNKNGDNKREKDVDAIRFAAAARIFAEWRSVRMVPESAPRTSGYSMGIGIARRDLVQNVGKLEAAVRSWFAAKHQQQQHRRRVNVETNPDTSSRSTTTGRTVPTCPTLRQLLQHEVLEGIHHRRPYLADKSGASGLLWIKRQLQYQTAILQNTAQIPSGAFPDSTAAAKAAYKTTYEDYHGFFVRQMFLRSCDATPEAEEIVRMIGNAGACDSSSDDDDIDDENELQIIEDYLEEEDDADGYSWFEVPAAPSSDSSILSTSTTSTAEADDTASIMSPALRHQQTNNNVIDQVIGHFAGEWMKFQGFVEGYVGHCAGTRVVRSHSSRDIIAYINDESDNDYLLLASSAEDSLLLSPPPPSSDVVVVSKSAAAVVVNVNDTVIPAYLGTMIPLLKDLDRLIDEFNMNDPSKV